MLTKEPLLLGDQWWERIKLEESRLIDLSARSCGSAARTTPKPHVNTLRSITNSHLENLDDVDGQPGFLADLAFQCLGG